MKNFCLLAVVCIAAVCVSAYGPRVQPDEFRIEGRAFREAMAIRGFRVPAEIFTPSRAKKS